MGTSYLTDFSHYLDIHEAVAAGFGSEATIRRHVASGELPRVKVIRDGRRKNVFDPADLARVLGPQSAPVNPAVAESALEDAVDAVVAKAPKLNSAQRERLSVVIAGGA